MDEEATRRPRLVLTGATGFIGQHLQRHLLAGGYDVAAIVRPDTPHAARLLPGVQVLRLRLDDEAALADALRAADFAVYAAGTVRGARAEDFTAANVSGVQHVTAAAARAMPHPRVLLLSSRAATRPGLSWYAASKRAGETVVAARPRASWVILRPPAVYGPGERELLPLLRTIRRGFVPILGPRGQRLALLHVDDLARAVIAALAHFAACAGGHYALDDGTPMGYDWPMLARAVRGSGRLLRIPVPRALLAALAALNLAAARGLARAPLLTPGQVGELSEADGL